MRTALDGEQRAEELSALCSGEEYNHRLVGCGDETHWLTRFNSHGCKRFLNRLHESRENVRLRQLSLSVPPMSDVTRILSAIEQGDPLASQQLLPLVYDELRKLAASKEWSARRQGRRSSPLL